MCTSPRIISRVLWIGIIILASTFAGCATAPPLRSRHEFAAALAQVQPGMPAARVLEILGKPDDICTREDPAEYRYSPPDEAWYYGSAAHRGFATLGTVYFDAIGRVGSVHGTQGADELVATIGEPKLRRILRLVAAANPPDLSPLEYDPRPTIRVINALQPLGKKAGVAVLREYDTLSAPRRSLDDLGFFLVMRALFEPPAVMPLATEDHSWRVVNPGFFRKPAIAIGDWTPRDPTKLPQFPLVIIDGIPLVPTNRIGMGGTPERAIDHLDELAQGGLWRAQPLRPTRDPLAVLAKADALLASAIAPDEHLPDNIHELIQRQLLHAVQSVHHTVLNNEDKEPLPPEEVDRIFRHAIPQVRDLAIHWDARRQNYVFRDGTTLPEEITPVYHIANYEPVELFGYPYSITLHIERRNGRHVDVEVRESDESGLAPRFRVEATTLNASGTSQPPDTIVDLEPGHGITRSVITSHVLDLPQGQSVQFTVYAGDRKCTSPIYTP
jgi:hypothetical protein